MSCAITSQVGRRFGDTEPDGPPTYPVGAAPVEGDLLPCLHRWRGGALREGVGAEGVLRRGEEEGGGVGLSTGEGGRPLPPLGLQQIRGRLLGMGSLSARGRSPGQEVGVWETPNLVLGAAVKGDALHGRGGSGWMAPRLDLVCLEHVSIRG